MSRAAKRPGEDNIMYVYMLKMQFEADLDNVSRKVVSLEETSG